MGDLSWGACGSARNRKCPPVCRGHMERGWCCCMPTANAGASAESQPRCLSLLLQFAADKAPTAGGLRCPSEPGPSRAGCLPPLGPSSATTPFEHIVDLIFSSPKFVTQTVNVGQNAWFLNPGSGGLYKPLSRECKGSRNLNRKIHNFYINHPLINMLCFSLNTSACNQPSSI